MRRPISFLGAIIQTRPLKQEQVKTHFESLFQGSLIHGEYLTTFIAKSKR
jgi:hypothetical protein